MLKARSRMPMRVSLAMDRTLERASEHPSERAPARRSERRRSVLLEGCRARLATLAALVPVALGLPRQVLRAQVDRVGQLARRLPGPQGHALEEQRGLGNLVLRDGRVPFLEDLHLQPREFGHLL